MDIRKFNETLLHIPRAEAVRSAADDCWEVKSKNLKIWTDPSPEEERVYINVYKENSSVDLRRIKAVTGIIFVPVILGDIIRFHIKEHNLFLDMKDFDFERVTYQSVEFCPMLLWTVDALECVYVPGIKDRIEIDVKRPTD